MKRTLVLGASPNPDRYSNMAINLLRRAGHPVVAVGLREGNVGDVAIQKDVPEGEEIDTLTMYLSAENQKPWIPAILNMKPRRVIFNPGAENPDFAGQLAQSGIETEEACTLVLIRSGQY
jgi:hypothetical protein